MEMPHYLLLRLYLLTDQSQPPGDIKIGHTFSYLCRSKWKLTSSDLQNRSPWQRHSCQGGHFEQQDPDGQAPRFQDSASLTNISSKKCQISAKNLSNVCQKSHQISVKNAVKYSAMEPLQYISDKTCGNFFAPL